MAETTPAPAKPSTSTPPAQPAPAVTVEQLKLKAKQISDFYATYVGRTDGKEGFNPYFYLYSKDFFTLDTKLKQGTTLTQAEVNQLLSIECKEELARPPKRDPNDIYRQISVDPVPQLANIPGPGNPVK